MPRVRKLRLIKESEKATQVRQTQARDTFVEVWIPKSKIDHLTKYPKNPDGTQDLEMDLPEWLCEEKGLDYD